MKLSERVFENVDSKRHKTMSHIRGKDTSIEITLRKALWRKGYRYRKNYKKIPGTPDIALTKYRIAIFCDSEFWHGKDWENLHSKLEKGNNPRYWTKKIAENIERDHEKDSTLTAMGWKVMHFWEKDIENDLETCLRTIEEAVLESIECEVER